MLLFIVFHHSTPNKKMKGVIKMLFTICFHLIFHLFVYDYHLRVSHQTTIILFIASSSCSMFVLLILSIHFSKHCAMNDKVRMPSCNSFVDAIQKFQNMKLCMVPYHRLARRTDKILSMRHVGAAGRARQYVLYSLTNYSIIVMAKIGKIDS